MKMPIAKWSCVLGIVSFAVPIIILLLAFIISSSGIIMISLGGAYFLGACISFVASILAIVFGIKALRKIKAQPFELQGKGLALIGIILGSIWLFLNIIGIIVFVVYIIPRLFMR